jgi:phosphopantetheine adenylyltransferase
MKDYKQLIKELPSKSVVMAFGRFNPPTIGHELLVKAVKKLAQQKKADHVIYASRSQDAKKNPLSVDKKVKYLNLMFKSTNFVGASDNVRTFIEAAKELNKKYKNLIMVAGSDRVPEFNRLLNTYNGKEFNFDTIEVISAGERDPDADDASGMSASKMRALAVKGDYTQFKKGLPSSVREIDGRRLMNDIREGMGLDHIKEQIVLVKNELREKYFRGDIFNEGDIVESNGEKYTIIKRGSNHLLLKEESGSLISKWIYDVQPTEERDMNEELTDKTLKVNDKVKVARMIATMLGVDNAESSSNPENLVNSALRKVRTKALNAEALAILDKMLVMATEVGIDYDATLKPSKLKEETIHVGYRNSRGDWIKTTTHDNYPDAKAAMERLVKAGKKGVQHRYDNNGSIDPGMRKLANEATVNKNSKYNIAKDVLRFNDFKKLKKIQEHEESESDNKKDNESDHDHEHNHKGVDKSEVGHTLVGPGKQDNLRRRKVKYHLGEQSKPQHMDMTSYGDEAGHENTAQHIATSGEHTKKQKKLAQGFLSKMQGSVSEAMSARLKLADALRKQEEKRKASEARAKLMMQQAKEKDDLVAAHKKEKENLTKEEVDLEEGMKQTLRKVVPGYAKREIDQKMDAGKFGKTDVDKDANFQRYKKIQDKLNKEEVELEESMTASWQKVQSMDKGSITGSKEDAKKRLAYLHAVHAHHKKFGNDTKKVKDEIERINRSRLTEEQEEPCEVCGMSPCQCDHSDTSPAVDMSAYEPDLPEMSDDEIEKMADELTDDDYLETYDDDELAIIDDETGEEIEPENEEEKLKEDAIMEVLSRVERIKAATRIRRTQAKRERAAKIAIKRYSNTATINKRSRRLAIKLMKKRLLRGRDPAKLSVGEKERIERTIEQRKAVIGRIAMRLTSRVRKMEKARLSHSKYTQGSQNVAF